jgi:hypothetical protein
MSNRKEVWTTSPRGEGKKDFWLRVGTAFENRDGSWSLVLDALPISGKLIMRDERPRDQADAPPRRTETRAAPRAQDVFGGPPDDSDIPF